jgi:hypothetical protein
VWSSHERQPHQCRSGAQKCDSVSRSAAPIAVGSTIISTALTETDFVDTCAAHRMPSARAPRSARKASAFASSAGPKATGHFDIGLGDAESGVAGLPAFEGNAARGSPSLDATSAVTTGAGAAPVVESRATRGHADAL